MWGPRIAKKIRRRRRRDYFMVKDDRITEFPDAKPQEQPKDDREKHLNFAQGGFAFRFHVPVSVPLTRPNGNLRVALALAFPLSILKRCRKLAGG